MSHRPHARVPSAHADISGRLGRCAHNGSVRVIAEMHYTRHSTEAQLSRLGPSSPLAHVASTCGCKLVLATRLREPLSFYVSFYQWTVAWRQARETIPNSVRLLWAGHGAPFHVSLSTWQKLNASAYGASMLEWAPRNLQSAIFLKPLDATWAEYTGGY